MMHLLVNLASRIIRTCQHGTRRSVYYSMQLNTGGNNYFYNGLAGVPSPKKAVLFPVD